MTVKVQDAESGCERREREGQERSRGRNEELEMSQQSGNKTDREGRAAGITKR